MKALFSHGRLFVLALAGLALLLFIQPIEAGPRGAGIRGGGMGPVGGMGRIHGGFVPGGISGPLVIPGPLVVPIPTAGDAEEAPEQKVKQATRYLRLKNETGGKLTVYLQYRTETDKGNLKWYPADPRTSTDAFSVTLKAGQETLVSDADWIVHASRVRIWAVSDSGEEWSEFKDKDLWLVPEVDQEGRHYYYAASRETATHTFGR